MKEFSVYLVLPSDRLAGCEKRLLGVASHLATISPNATINIVATSSMFQRLDESVEFGRLRAKHNLTWFHLGCNSSSYAEFWWKCFLFFLRQPRQIIVHYPLAYPVFIKFLFNHSTIVSWVDNTLPSRKYQSIIAKILAWISFFEADIVDVLNPSNFKVFSASPWMRGKVLLTDGGTHVDPNIYKPTTKEYSVVFMGRLIPEKQGYRYLQSLPAVCRILRSKGLPVPSFSICGWGPEERLMLRCLASVDYAQVPVEMFRSDNPSELLSSAMIFVSLQKSSNYPSKALAEAMMCGAIPVLTSSPDSELMISSDLPHSLIPVDFSPQDIACSIEKAWTASMVAGDALHKAISSAASQRFSVSVQSAYFGKVYDRLIK